MFDLVFWTAIGIVIAENLIGLFVIKPIMKIQTRNRRRRGEFRWQRKPREETDPRKLYQLQPEGAGAPAT